MPRVTRRRAVLAAATLAAVTATAAPAAAAPGTPLGRADGALHREPAPALNERGDALATWVRAPLRAPARGVVRVAGRRGPRGAWSPARTLSGPGASGPRAALTASRDALVVWAEAGGLAAASRRGPAGRWTARRLADAVAPQGLRLDLAPDGGRARVAWSERAPDGRWQVRYAVRPAASEPWVTPAPALLVPGPAAPAVAMGPRRGGLLAAWAEGGSGDGRVRVAALAGVEWSAATAAEDPAVATAAALSPRGDALVAWATGLPGGSRVIAARDRPAGRDLRPPADVGLGIGPRAAINARGDAVIAWQSMREGGGRGIDAVVRRRFAARWAPTTVVPPACTCDLALGDLALSARGDAVATWYRDARPGAGRGAVGVLPAGGDRWLARVVGPADPLRPPVMAVNARGRVLALVAHAEAGAPIRAAGRPRGR